MCSKKPLRGSTAPKLREPYTIHPRSPALSRRQHMTTPEYCRQMLLRALEADGVRLVNEVHMAA